MPEPAPERTPVCTDCWNPRPSGAPHVCQSRPAPVADLLGADPEYLGGQSVDDYIREARRDR